MKSIIYFLGIFILLFPIYDLNKTYDKGDETRTTLHVWCFFIAALILYIASVQN